MIVTESHEAIDGMGGRRELELELESTQSWSSSAGQLWRNKVGPTPRKSVHCKKSSRSSEGCALFLEASSALRPPCLRALARFLLPAFSSALLGWLSVDGCWGAFVEVVTPADVDDADIEEVAAVGVRS